MWEFSMFLLVGSLGGIIGALFNKGSASLASFRTRFWYKYVGLDGEVVSINRFGASAPGGQLMEEFGFTVDNVVNAVNKVL